MDLDVVQLPVFLADTAFLDDLKAVGRRTAPEPSLLYDLPQSRFGPYRGLQALAGRLPVPDVIHQPRRILGCASPEELFEAQLDLIYAV